jgi:hypothetical protein
MDASSAGGSVEEPPNRRDLKQFGGNPTGFASCLLSFI